MAKSGHRSAISVARPRPLKPRRPLAPSIRVPRQIKPRRHSTNIPIKTRDLSRAAPGNRSGSFRFWTQAMITRHEPLHERYRRSADTGPSYSGRDHASGTRSSAVNRIQSLGKWFNSNLAPLNTKDLLMPSLIRERHRVRSKTT